MIPSNVTSILKSLISTKLNPLFSKLNGLFFSRKTPEAKKPVPADSKTAEFIERHEKSTEELKVIEVELSELFRRDDGGRGLNAVQTKQTKESSDKSKKSSGGKNNYLTKIPLSPVLEECSLDLSPEEITHEHVPTPISTPKVQLDEHDGPERKKREQPGIPCPLNTESLRHPDDPRYNGYRGVKGLIVGSVKKASGEEPGLAPENHGAGTKITPRSKASLAVVPASSLKMPPVPTERVPLSSLREEQESSLPKSNENNKKSADISLVRSKERNEDLSNLQVSLNEHDGPERGGREQLGIDPYPLNTNSGPGCLPPTRIISMRKSLVLGDAWWTRVAKSGLDSENNGAGTKITPRSEAFNAVVPKSSLHEIVTKQVSPDPQQNHHS